jgi:hypothetical protein
MPELAFNPTGEQMTNSELPAAGVSYERHRPEETLLYQIVEEHWL